MARRTGTAKLPLHRGRAPRWLFERMARLAPAEFVRPRRIPIRRDARRLRDDRPRGAGQITLEGKRIARLDMPARHGIDVARDVSPRNLESVLLKSY